MSMDPIIVITQAAVQGWTEPRRYTCAGCGAVEPGSLGSAFFGEPIDCIPEGWLRKRVEGKSAFACCVHCAVDADAKAASQDVAGKGDG